MNAAYSIVVRCLIDVRAGAEWERVASKARGKWIQKDIGQAKPWIIASFHPAFLMRQPEQKKLAWIDLKMIREKSKSLKI